MTPRDFAYFMQSYFELVNPTSIDAETTKKIKAHLNLVFIHTIDPEEEKSSGLSNETINAIHNGTAALYVGPVENPEIKGFKPVTGCNVLGDKPSQWVINQDSVQNSWANRKARC